MTMKKMLSIALFTVSLGAYASPSTTEPSLDLSTQASQPSVMLAGKDRQRGASKIERVETTVVKTTRVTGKNARKQKQKSDAHVSRRAVVSHDQSGATKTGKMRHGMHDGAKARRAKKKEQVVEANLNAGEKVN